ncbi:MAG: hypothetical protein GY847_06435 [Proteobacteria bacterium]|nr:hypothetical protein [Pseudomonadota bacterium]
MPEPEGPTLTLTIEIDPCTLLTKADVESVLGEAVGDGRERDTISPAGKRCTYATKEIATLKEATLTIHSTEDIIAEGIFDSAEDVYNRQKNAVLDSDHGQERFQEVTGFGEDACWVDGTLRILQDDRYITIEVSGLPVEGAASSEELQEMIDTKTLAAEKTLAEMALQRLP